MSYRQLITGILHGTIVGINLSVATYLAERSSGVPFIKVGLGAAAGLIMAGFLTSQEIHRTELSLERNAASGTYSHLFQANSDDVGAIKRAQTIAGASPLVGIGVVLLPFTLQGVLITQRIAVVASVIIGIVFLFGFGTWLGFQTNREGYAVGLRIAGFGLIAAALNLVLP